MKRTRLIWLVFALAALALVAAACTGAIASGGNGGERDRPVGSSPMPVPPDDGGAGAPDTVVKDDPGFPTEPALAPIDELDLLVRESYPPQYALRVVSGLPSGCASYDRTAVERDGDTITVTVWNRVPAEAGQICTMVYGMHEQTVELGSDFESGSEYTVKVNGEVLTFVAQ